MSNLKFELLIGMNGSGKSTYLQNKYDELTVTKKGTINPNRAYISNSEINFSAELKKDYSKTIKDLIELLYEKNFVLKLDEKNINNIASYKKIIEDDKIILDNLKHDEDFSF
ncbi:MAG: hypothetical protein LBV69_09750 [Bacteroidales bacterium]|jgi:ABC-type Mn2+/Zn2+ transport system ATPase subunit|nr:hypothetical protein [Bacteroidales bacterium]